jgi:hypothetical protein
LSLFWLVNVTEILNRRARMKRILLLLIIICISTGLAGSDDPVNGNYEDPESLADAVYTVLWDNDVTGLHKMLATTEQMDYFVGSIPNAASFEPYRKLWKIEYDNIARKYLKDLMYETFEREMISNVEYEYEISTGRNGSHFYSTLSLTYTNAFASTPIHISAFKYSGFWRILVVEKGE